MSNPQNAVDAEKLSLVELKALAYDQVLELNRIQLNVRTIEEIIRRKQLSGNGEAPKPE